MPLALTALDYVQGVDVAPLSGDELLTHKGRVKILSQLEKRNKPMDRYSDWGAEAQRAGPRYNALNIDEDYFDYSRHW